ncbi:PspC domain-containing protein [Nonomuraea sp. NPDC001023]|uniref:PspC domain-containing protein n=1 Tax=unclassified Nonomuraea TaxID=2593643 RepID=UPI0033208611
MNEYSEHNVKKLRRTNKGRMIAGVCSGIGEYVGIDANLIRVGLAIATLFGGAGVGLYAIGWLLLPDEERDTSIVQDLISKQQQQRNAADWTGEHKPQQ